MGHVLLPFDAVLFDMDTLFVDSEPSDRHDPCWVIADAVHHDLHDVAQAV